jgi:hypothetical protein
LIELGEQDTATDVIVGVEVPLPPPLPPETPLPQPEIGSEIESVRIGDRINSLTDARFALGRIIGIKRLPMENLENFVCSPV